MKILSVEAQTRAKVANFLADRKHPKEELEQEKADKEMTMKYKEAMKEERKKEAEAMKGVDETGSDMKAQKMEMKLKEKETQKALRDELSRVEKARNEREKERMRQLKEMAGKGRGRGAGKRLALGAPEGSPAAKAPRAEDVDW